MKLPDDRLLSPEERAALAAGRTIIRNGVRLNFKQWMVARIADQGGVPSGPLISPEFTRWLGQYYKLCKELERYYKKEQELRAKIEVHAATIPQSKNDPRIELTPPFPLQGQKRKQGHREFARRDSDLSEHDAQVLDAINDYQDCFYEILKHDFGMEKWTKKLGIPHPTELALSELFGQTHGDEDFERVLKDAATRRSLRARQRRRTRRKISAS
jgi:hypothetical protein